MKILKIIGGIIAVVVAIYLIMCALGPNKFEGSATVEMDAPASVVYDIVTDMTTWEEWIPWKKQDPSMVLTMGEKTKGLGASYSWESDMMGSGSLEIVETEANKSMRNKLNFEGFEGNSYGIWKFAAMDANKSKATWAMESENAVPFWMRGMMLMGESMEETFTNGLNALNIIAAKKAKELASMPKKYRGYTVNTLEIPTQYYITHREKIPMANISTFFGTHFPAIAGKAAANMTGMPRALYYEWDQESGMTDLAAAIPVKSAMDIEGYTSVTVPKGKALHIDYYGSYDGGAEAHYAMDDYMKANGLESELVMEEYANDPVSEPDTSKWLTKIYYTLK
jgi:effector-binding domain-containing protein